MANYELLKGDRRKTELISWEPWFQAVGDTRKAFRRELDFDPMVNETASVGVLASAANKAGLLAIAEYVCTKRRNQDGRSYGNGRADLWVSNPARDASWSFEAKQFRCAPGARLSTLEGRLQRACHDAARVPHWEADGAYGVLIATVAETGSHAGLNATFDALAKTSFAACRFEGGSQPVFAFFRKAKKMRAARGN